ncbi:MAG: hypothetical protein JNL56_15105 [Alphaproteobacteria bacterium]|nr:hypothetical protein [Alphaproteobacteria bacterium]
MLYVIFLLTLALLVVLGLTSLANGAGPAALAPVQKIVKPAADPLKGIVGVFGVIAVIWGSWNVIRFVVSIEGLRYGALSQLIGLVTCLVLVTVGVLAAYVSVAAFFGAPASGAGKFVDWFKKSFGNIESAVGLTALVLALWMLIEFILNRSGVYI